MSVKVVIPSAGLGSRVGPYSKFLNKALITVGDKPVISRVIEKFPATTPFIILLGYKGEMVEEVVKTLHPELNLTFVYVENFDGPGSGLGHTLMMAKEYLQSPFIFIPNDAILGTDNVALDPIIEGNWVGFYRKNSTDNYKSEDFRTLEISEDGSQVVDITGKGTLNENIYIGVCGVKDTDDFWAAMADHDDPTVGEVVGLKALASLKPVIIKDWFDCGSLAYLRKAKELFKNQDHNILEKEDETIWFQGNEVIKFSVDTKFIADRVERLEYLPHELTPDLIKAGKFTYSYKRVEGSVISNILTPPILENLLQRTLNSMWSVKGEVTTEVVDLCYQFYKNKSYSRLDHYCKRFEQIDGARLINGRHVRSVREMYDALDWSTLCEKPYWTSFHGDFHGENILFTSDDSFRLLDWRQSFGGISKNFGDAYYDLAKLRHGFLVNHGIVDKGSFQLIEKTQKDVFLSIDQKSNLLDCDSFFKDWLNNNHFSVQKVELLSALIYLNICGLHEYPYSKFLYLYGQYLLSCHLDDVES